MIEDGGVFVGRSVRPELLALRLSNRHGLITGATGTGKTVTLQVLAEGFSEAGVPVFAADVKGDLSGIAAEGSAKDFLVKRAEEVQLPGGYRPGKSPTIFWDLFGKKGTPIRATMSEMGPLLLARLLNLNDTQEGVLNIVFKYADDNGYLLLDLKDLQSVLVAVAEAAGELTTKYGNVSKTTVGAIQRQLLVLDQQGGANFFGEPALQLADMMRTTRDGRGYVNILAADTLINSPRLYATFLLWLMSELFEDLPEVGDLDAPKLVFFFDEAHLLFDDAPDALVDKIEQVVRLIRSKGVGVYFVTQNPLDVPDKVSAQLGNRVQHALRAYTPREQKAVKAAATTFRPNPDLNTAQVITELGVGEALVSVLEGKGVPSIVQRTLIAPPVGRVGPITEDERLAILNASPVASTYLETVDRESAFEVLARKAGEKAAAANAPPTPAPQQQGGGGLLESILGGVFGGAATTASGKASTRMSTTEVVVRQVARSVATQVGNQVGRAILRGVLGSMTRR